MMTDNQVSDLLWFLSILGRASNLANVDKKGFLPVFTSHPSEYTAVHPSFLFREKTWN